MPRSTPMTYRDQLLSPHWQKKRLTMLEAAGWRCTGCHNDEATLHVHHRKYVKGRMAWEYDDSELVVLCEVCHEDTHKHQDDAKELLSRMPVDGPGCLRDAVQLLAGWLEVCSRVPGVESIGEDYWARDLGRLAGWIDWRSSGLEAVLKEVLKQDPEGLVQDLMRCATHRLESLRQQKELPEA